MSRRTHAPLFPTLGAVLPEGFTFCTVRIIHDMPDVRVDGWRVSLMYGENQLVEVIHCDLQYARSIAWQAAAELWPARFKECES